MAIYDHKYRIVYNKFTLFKYYFVCLIEKYWLFIQYIYSFNP